MRVLEKNLVLFVLKIMLFIRSMGTENSSAYISSFLQIFSSKADYFTSLRSVAFSDYAIDPFNNKWLFSALNDVSVEREEVVLDYKQNVLAFCAYFTCSMDVTGSGVEGEYHGKTIRFFRISEGAVLDGTLIYFDELINESINAVTESLIGDLGIKKEYSIESYF